MPPDLTITMDGAGSTDELRSLYWWLISDEEFRGRTRLVDQPPQPGTLGAPATEIIVAAFSGSGVASLVNTWIRHRSGQVRMVLSRAGTKVDIDLQRVRALSHTEAKALIVDLFSQLDAPGTGQPDGYGTGCDGTGTPDT
jgi:Effector Associated Constant Component 1